MSGLRPAYQYEQKYWGSSRNFNPMTQSMKGSIKGKSIIEVIRDYCLGSGAYIDVYPNKYGILQIEPYHKKDWLESNVTIPYHTIQDMKVKFDTKNIVTGVSITSSDSLKIGGSATSKELIGLDLAQLFGNNGASISTSKKTKTKTSKGNTKTVKNTTNPYGTKLKKIYINSDNIYGKSTDRQFMKDFAAAMRKQGWKTKIIGWGPNTHTEKYMNGCKDGVWFCIYGGADAAVFRETVKKNSYTNKLKSLNSRTVIGMRTGGNIRKGGKYYKWLPRAHDDNYSPSSFKGISYPLATLTKGKVPIMYANSVKDMVAKFLAGGDNKEAC